MAIKLYIENRGFEWAEQIFDWWYAYLQSQNQNYTVDIEFVTDFQIADRRILIDHMALTLCQTDFDRFDMLLIGNNGEPLETGTAEMQIASAHPRCFLITNSRLTPDHHLYAKNIWWPAPVYVCKDYWTKPFYPQFFELYKLANLKRTTGIIHIGCELRAWRWHFWQMVQNLVPSLALPRGFDQSIQSAKTLFWESLEDTKFRLLLENLYGTGNHSSDVDFFKAVTSVGINEKFGKLLPGYFLIDCFFDQSCIITPDSTWQNQTLDCSEKTLKCFVSGSLPFVISGSSVNQQYNDLGFATAWNLLPSHLQDFDKVDDHHQRYSLMAHAVAWLYQNRDDVFSSDEFRNLTENNRRNFFSNNIAVQSVEQFHEKIIKHCLNRHP